MNSLIRENRWFLVPYAIFFISGLFLYAFYSRTEIHIFSNELNFPAADFFFKYITNLGDGIVIPVFVFILLFVRYRYAVILASGGLLASLIVNALKKLVFEDMYRPSKYFEIYETYKLHFVKGVELHSLQSFPSGHSASAFNLFFMLAIIVKSNRLKFVFFILAFLTAYSRIYLSQHFLIDTLAGSLTGIITILIAAEITNKIERGWMDKKLILNAHKPE